MCRSSKTKANEADLVARLQAGDDRAFRGQAGVCLCFENGVLDVLSYLFSSTSNLN